MSTPTIPVIDFQKYGLQVQDLESVDREDIKGLGNQMCRALEDIGFCYLTNHEIKEGQVRCGEHSDYGTLTLLFQDLIGGLEVRTRDGEYIPATPIQGSVVVNIGDLMQRWTADRLIATRHRILMPSDEVKARNDRHSFALFVNPYSDCVVRCLDGSNKYPPITCLDYLNQRFYEKL